MADKALTKEDLVYILQEIFHISDTPNNAFQMLGDGLFVNDYAQDLENHTTDTDIHVTQFIKNILNNFSIDIHDRLLYNGLIVNSTISAEDKNALVNNTDGFYVKDFSDEMQELQDHKDDSDIHVTLNDKQTWDETLKNAKQFVLDEIAKLVIYTRSIVPELPTNLDDIEPTNLYLLEDDDTAIDLKYGQYMFINGDWVRMHLSKEFIETLATQEQLKDYALKTDLHSHENKEVLDKLSDNNGRLNYKGTEILDTLVSDKDDNGIELVDGKLYMKDHTKTIESMVISSAFTKVNLLNQECNDSGVYELKDYINNYSLLVIDFYYKPDDNDSMINSGNAKSVIVDTDTMETLYHKGVDYLLEIGYGISPANSKIRIYSDKLWIDYYHGCCIYNITGIRRGDDT